MELGINNGSEIVRKEGDEIFFENNCGEGKLYPGGPIYNLRGKQVPGSIRWNEKDEMTSGIPTKVLAKIDHLKLFPRSNNCKPILFVDDHGNRFGLDFLNISIIPLMNAPCVLVYHMVQHCGRWVTANNKISHITFR